MKTAQKITIFGVSVEILFNGEWYFSDVKQALRAVTFADETGKTAKRLKRQLYFNIDREISVANFVKICAEFNPCFDEFFKFCFANMCYQTLQTGVILDERLSVKWKEIIESSFEPDDRGLVKSMDLVPIMKTFAVKHMLPVPTPQALGVLMAKMGFQSQKKLIKGVYVNCWNINLKQQ